MKGGREVNRVRFDQVDRVTVREVQPVRVVVDALEHGTDTKPDDGRDPELFARRELQVPFLLDRAQVDQPFAERPGFSAREQVLPLPRPVEMNRPEQPRQRLGPLGKLGPTAHQGGEIATKNGCLFAPRNAPVRHPVKRGPKPGPFFVVSAQIASKLQQLRCRPGQAHLGQGSECELRQVRRHRHRRQSPMGLLNETESALRFVQPLELCGKFLKGQRSRPQLELSDVPVTWIEANRDPARGIRIARPAAAAPLPVDNKKPVMWSPPRREALRGMPEGRNSDWARLDSNQRRLSPTGLQPVPFGQLGHTPRGLVPKLVPKPSAC